MVKNLIIFYLVTTAAYSMHIHRPIPKPQRILVCPKPRRPYTQIPPASTFKERLKILNYALVEKQAWETVAQREHDLAAQHINECLTHGCADYESCAFPSKPLCLRNGKMFYDAWKQAQKDSVMLEMEIDVLERIIKEQ